MEMAVIKLCRREYDSSPEMLMSRINTLEEKIKSGSIQAAPQSTKNSVPSGESGSKKAKSPLEAGKEKPSSEKADESSPGISVSMDEVKACWQDAINLIKTSMKVTVAVMLSLGEIWETSGNTVVIGFDEQHAFSKNNLENPENKKIVEECFSKVMEKPVQVSFKVSEEENDIDKSIELTKEILGDNIVEVIED
jgi:DNA polymerase-3 subunit gamma/tau